MLIETELGNPRTGAPPPPLSQPKVDRGMWDEDLGARRAVPFFVSLFFAQIGSTVPLAQEKLRSLTVCSRR